MDSEEIPCAVVNSPEYTSHCLGGEVTYWTGKSEATLCSESVFVFVLNSKILKDISSILIVDFQCHK